MIFLTLGVTGTFDDAERSAVDTAVRSRGGRVAWRSSTRAARSYGLLDVPDVQSAAAIREATHARVYDQAIIALAVFPTVPEALPPLLEALGGPGRPAGVLACEVCEGGVVVEWDLERTPAGVVLGLIDAELRRFNSGRTTEVLSPLPPAWITKIAADGLQAPHLAPDRILETLVERSGLTADGVRSDRV